MQHDAKYGLAYQLISDILSQQDILMSVNSAGGSIAEIRVEKGLPFRIREKWATIGDEDRQWHIHLNMEEVIEARFVKEPRSDGKQSYSIRFFDRKGNLSMRANFTKMYDSNGNLLNEKVAAFEEMYIKYGTKGLVSLRSSIIGYHNCIRTDSNTRVREVEWVISSGSSGSSGSSDNT